MIWLLIIIGSFIISLFSGMTTLASIAVAISVFLFFQVVLRSNQIFVFREFALLLYALNYLLSPAITYLLPTDSVFYKMRLSSDEYFSLAIPGFFCLAAGMYFFKTRVFKPVFTEINIATFLNDKLLIRALIIGVIFRFLSAYVPGELSFFFYLLSLIRFVSGFALFAFNPSRNWYFLFFLLIVELYNGFIIGMYHDAIMWIIFSGLFCVYVLKPSLSLKLISGFTLVFFIFFVQAIKGEYRSLVWGGDRSASLNTVIDVGSSKFNNSDLFGEANLFGTLNRGNQAWILASTIDRMDRFSDFQGLALIGRYLEAALLPRFLAPNKINSGDKEIFNQFSGHEIYAGTSMGLGIFSDGYIAYGVWGILIFGFMLGLLFSITFKLVEYWSRISPIYILFLLPLLNYAVRPDCELQTTINHLTKGIFVYGLIVFITSRTFSYNPLLTRKWVRIFRGR